VRLLLTFLKYRGVVVMKTEELEVQLTNEHLTKLLKIKPIQAIEELIWNSLDADADEIEVIIDRNELNGIESITIKDNGTGIGYQNISNHFGNLGDSYKSQKKFSTLGRKYHGRQGEGRYSAFVLGENVIWQSFFKEDEKCIKFNITGDLKQLKIFHISQPEDSLAVTSGVIVKITNLVHETINKLPESINIFQTLSAIFAPYLMAYSGIKIYIDGYLMDPFNQIENVIEHDITAVSDSEGIVRGTLKVIEWKSGKHKNIYICNSENYCIDEERSSVRTGLFSHTAFLKSNIINNLINEHRLEVREFDSGYVLLREEALKIIKNIYLERLADAASIEVKKIKEEKIYPYDGEPKNEVDRASRQIFDIFAYKVNELLPEFRKNTKSSKQFTYRLLKESLETNPTTLKYILSEVLNLSMEQQNELASILEKTSFKSIINTTNLITNRISFLYGIEEILCGKEIHKRVKERSQLHKILLNELWLFGEHYNYSYDDITLKNVLKQHIKELGRAELIDKIDFTTINDLNDIPDIGLSRQCVVGEQDNYENLVIELKRPSCIITEKELNQIKKYAYTIEENMYFDKEKTKWKFILLGTKFDKYTKKELNQSNRPQGLLYKSNDINLEVWVKEWNQVIQEAKGKYQHLKDKLELNMTNNEEGLNYLREKYKDYMPD
jgi:Histidine kinase-, DNA gyrase B-, and HSP90-like ATPase